VRVSSISILQKSMDHRFSPNYVGRATVTGWQLCASVLCLFCASAPLKGENWEGAKLTKVLVDGKSASRPPSTSMACAATRNGCRVAILVRDLSGNAVIVDGAEGPPYDDIREETPVFSADGAGLAYCARKDRKWRWVINGVEGPPFEKLTATSFAFSADGKHHAYIAIPGYRQNVLVVDGKVMPGSQEEGAIPYDAAPVFSPDGSRLAYVEEKNQSMTRVNVDGKADPWNRGVGLQQSPGFGAYNTQPNAQGTLERARPPVFGLIFSADSKHFAYSEFADGRQRWLIDGTPTSFNDESGNFVFAPSGGDYAYMALRGGQRSIFGRKGKLLQINTLYDDTLTFSPDGRHLAFAGIRDGKKALWMDGEAVPVDFEIQTMKNVLPRFSPDSKRIAYCAEGPKSIHWVVDGHGGPGMLSAADNFEFSPDSAHFCHIIMLSAGKEVGVVVDGKVRATHRQVVGVAFRNDGTLEYLADEGVQLFRFRVEGY
jgi:Tol biopolymer transport system component